VYGADLGAAAGQAAADVGQTGPVGGGQIRRTGAGCGGALVGQHRPGHVRVLQRERAAEAAALLGVRQRHQVDAPHPLQQAPRLVAQAQQPQPVTGRVVGHPVRERRADVGHAEHVDQELGQLEGAGGDPRHRLVLRRQPRIAVTHHRHARSGGCDHRVVRGEGVHEVAQQRQRLGPVAAVGVHLPAAGLGGGELHGPAQALQDRHHRPRGVREE
jgi:hypothetical protein